MERTRLHNDDWGMETNCFVCEPKNGTGLQIPFFHNHDADTVEASFVLTDAFSGAPGFVHGGISLAILDEAMAWACIAVAHRWAVTSSTSTQFPRPVLVGQEFRVTAHIERESETEIETRATIFNGEDKPCAVAGATFLVLGEAQSLRIAEAAGANEEAIDATYLRDDAS